MEKISATMWMVYGSRLRFVFWTPESLDIFECFHLLFVRPVDGVSVELARISSNSPSDTAVLAKLHFGTWS